MKLHKIQVSNFKFIKEDKVFELNFTPSNLILLTGPNGYGKTTVFDIIELLITGTIKHFNSELLNRGKESFSIMANNPEKDLVITAYFQEKETSHELKRIFSANENFKSYILYNSNKVEEKIIYDLFDFNKNFFELGMYISQSDSLNFLQQKYKSRKESISGILDNQNITIKVEQLKKIRDSLASFIKSFKEELDKKENILLSTENTLSEKLKAITNTENNLIYYRLFKDKEYIFDKENFKEDDNFEYIFSEIEKLVGFTKNYKSYIEQKHNNEIRQILATNNDLFVALYFKKDIQECRENETLAKSLFAANEVKLAFEQQKYTLPSELLEFLHIDSSILLQIRSLLEQRTKLEKNLTATEHLLNEIIKKRHEFIVAFEKAKSNTVLSQSACPLCGRESDEIDALLKKTEESFTSSLGTMAESIKLVNKELITLYKKEVISKIEPIITQYSLFMQKYTYLNTFIKYDTSKLERKLITYEIHFSNTAETINLEHFKVELSSIKDKLENKIFLLEQPIAKHTFEQYDLIYKEFYIDKAPHSIEILEKKKEYITFMYSSNLNKKILENQRKKKHFEENEKKQLIELDLKLKNIKKLYSVYQEEYKKYQSKIAQNIAIPMFIFSGKIIQNYPLGLGISLEIQDNAIIFKSNNKITDVFNSLSTGQLNGLIISLLLSIHAVFSSDRSLKLILIDDPLQSIDDISAISFVDLLADYFSDTQIILSTHELDKEQLLYRKYEQIQGQKPKVYNMHDEYLSIV